MSRAQAIAALAVVASAALAIALYSQQSRAADQGVSVTDFQFSPGNVTIDVGDSVTFSFNGGTHGVQWTGGPPAPNSDTLSSGTFVFTPTEPGTYNYVCSVHGAGMSGLVNVQGQQQPTNSPTSTSVPPTNTATSPAATDTPTSPPATNTPTPVPATAVPTNTPTPAGPTSPATSDPTDTPEPADTPDDDATTTPTPIDTATGTATPAPSSDTEPTGTPDVPDTAADGDGDDDGGSSWGVLIIVAVVLVALVGLVLAILSLRNRPTPV